MADSKKKAVVKKDFRAMDEKSLQSEIAEMRASLVENRKANAAQELPSTAVIRKTRKDIAKALTMLREKKVAPAKEQEK
jgi:large subunit ribosomal protein L29